MSLLNESESLDDEVKELLKNYKCKKATDYEPCNENNLKECLIALSEEFDLLNIRYVFNPYLDMKENTLTSEALVKFINSVWILLQKQKNISEKAESLAERKHILESNNKQLNGIVSKLKEKLNLEKNESKACVASVQRVSDKFNETYQQLIEARAKLLKLKKQKETIEKGLLTKIAKLQLENNKLIDRLRSTSDSHTPCSDVCDSKIRQLKEWKKKQHGVIIKLQNNNEELLNEVLKLKEELVLEGLQDVELSKEDKL